MSDWNCQVCGTPVSWGTDVCPLCGSALEWEEGDEEDHYTAVMPYDWEQEEEIAFRRRRTRNYALGAIGAGVLLVALGLLSQFMIWAWIVPGVILIGAGVYGLVTLPHSYDG
jgi:hypothetical protein